MESAFQHERLMKAEKQNKKWAASTETAHFMLFNKILKSSSK